MAESWSVPGSVESIVCVNPVRNVVEDDCTEALTLRDLSVELIDTSTGDPTRFGTLPVHPAVTEAILKVVQSGKYNGYYPSNGILETREAVAQYFSRPQAPLTAQDVVMTSSCSGAMDITAMVLCNPGQSILLPMPCFGLWKALAEARGVIVKYYNLLPDKGWEADLDSLEGAIDSTTAAIVVVNPSNPCGSVFSRAHLKAIVDVAQRHHLPIIADEIYDGMAFSGHEFVCVAEVSDSVPVLSCGAVSKIFMIPGWRLGWILIHDRNGAFQQQVRPGLGRLSRKILGPCTLVQAALPDILTNVPDSYKQRNLEFLERNARKCFEKLSKVDGLTPFMPAGAMYMMVNIDLERFRFGSDVDFIKALLIEESVFVMPGKAFCAQSCFRVVLILPDDKISEACKRIAKFCSKHDTAAQSN
ncbi:tyrosine aminotransferase-like [Halichondria panicea]|uniref:tyrosine aminotransferase-like n=1 Tax=Halichondria panicea TaxID=6063 RepID=UPI00312B9C0B